MLVSLGVTQLHSEGNWACSENVVLNLQASGKLVAELGMRRKAEN